MKNLSENIKYWGMEILERTRKNDLVDFCNKGKFGNRPNSH